MKVLGNTILHYSRWHENRFAILVVVVFTVLSYSLYFGLNRDVAISLALEDSVFEYLTAGFFLFSAFLFLRLFFRFKNYFFLLLSLLFFLACGEEVSWGQRILKFSIPDEIREQNVQEEFNLHNLEVFHPQDREGISKGGLYKLITVDFLYNLFWLLWCIIIPLLVFFSRRFDKLIKRIGLPVPVLSLGILFLVNFLALVYLRSLITAGKSDIFYMKIREVYESVSALIFLMIARYFYKQKLVLAHLADQKARKL